MALRSSLKASSDNEWTPRRAPRRPRSKGHCYSEHGSEVLKGPNSFLLDRAWGFRGDVVDDAVDAAYLIQVPVVRVEQQASRGIGILGP
jgi:hypothetical protein